MKFKINFNMIENNKLEVEIYQKNHCLIMVLGEEKYYDELGNKINELYPDSLTGFDDDLLKMYGNQAVLSIWNKYAGEENDVHKIFNEDLIMYWDNDTEVHEAFNNDLIYTIFN